MYPPLVLLLFPYLSAFFEKSENLGSDKFVRCTHDSDSPTILDIHFLFTRRLPNTLFVYLASKRLDFYITHIRFRAAIVLPSYELGKQKPNITTRG